MTAIVPDRFRAFLEAHREFLILSHVDPDADAIGSCLALARAIRGMGKGTAVVNDSPLPDSLRFLPDSDQVLRPSDVQGRAFDAAFVLDCSSLDRVGPDAARLVVAGMPVANVDHHAANDGFGDPRLVNVDASATAELIHEILEACGLPIDADTAECLYAGVASDTGAFRHPNTTPRALRLAARLVERGARPALTAEALYGRKTEASLRILGMALTSLEAHSGGQVGVITLSRDMFERARATSEDADGIVQFAKSLVGTRVGLLVQEVAPGEVRLSFRSDGTVDVNQVAARFGGGGHKNAAGARVKGDLRSIHDQALEALDRAVNGGFPPSTG
ncbi:MAG TPA: bifunctional oligoribonuclease/PAP phosphatase NrnA [Candidatus Eisenbacteria bacterium]|nr:bifunctional oligoribonuclease/PAP phosphatase NrnA [Candidatus Eisenbacteria bacterium]